MGHTYKNHSVLDTKFSYTLLCFLSINSHELKTKVPSQWWQDRYT